MKEDKKEILTVKKEAKKEIKELESKNNELLQLLLQTLAAKEKSNSQIIVSIVSLSLNALCWAICFFMLFKG